MPNIKDIIEAATPGPWHIEIASWNSEWFKGTPLIKGGYPERHIAAVDSGYKREDNVNARFIFTFDPEHVALMEAEIQAGRKCDTALGRGAIFQAESEYDFCKQALDAYRRERWYSGQ